MSDTALVGLDWGTTAARAYRLDRSGRVLEARSAPLGIQHVPAGGFADAYATLLGAWRDLAVPCIACGMIGSRQGWHEAPYCTTPASLPALAGGLVRVPGAQLAIVPGVSTRDAAGMPDVMRGEETQILGAVGPEEHRAVVVLPGTHSKWATVERGALTAFTTYMTGELYAALLAHTILGRLAQASAAAGDDAFARGVARGLAGTALTHDLFGARTLALFGELAPAGVADWLSGLLIGAEIRAARDAVEGDEAVRIVADAALAQRYARACEQAGLRATMAAPDAAARGLWRIARAAGLA